MDTLAFANGIGTIGNLTPKTLSIPKGSIYSAWTAVANDFYKAGNDLRSAIVEADKQQK